MKRAASVLILTALVAGLAASSDRAPASPRSPSTLAGNGGLIVYQSYSDSGARRGGLYVIGSDGRGDRRIPNQPSTSVTPKWSPDGRRIAFSVGKGNSLSLFAIKPDGSGLRRLLKGTASNSASFPAWSPDGRSIAFVRGAPCASLMLCNGHISILSLTSGKVSNLPHSSGAIFAPSWSPDGKTIAFSRTEPLGLWIVKVNGSGLKRLSHGLDSLPDWSPGGRWIAFTRFQAGKNESIWAVTRTGTFATFDNEIGPYAGPSWSPNGSKLAFSMSKGDNGDICTMLWSNGKAHCLARTPKTDDTLPDWQPLPASR